MQLLSSSDYPAQVQVLLERGARSELLRVDASGRAHVAPCRDALGLVPLGDDAVPEVTSLHSCAPTPDRLGLLSPGLEELALLEVEVTLEGAFSAPSPSHGLAMDARELTRYLDVLEEVLSSWAADPASLLGSWARDLRELYRVLAAAVTGDATSLNPRARELAAELGVDVPRTPAPLALVDVTTRYWRTMRVFEASGLDFTSHSGAALLPLSLVDPMRASDPWSVGDAEPVLGTDSPAVLDTALVLVSDGAAPEAALSAARALEA
jgi:hypothetical protein